MWDSWDSCWDLVSNHASIFLFFCDAQHRVSHSIRILQSVHLDEELDAQLIEITWTEVWGLANDVTNVANSGLFRLSELFRGIVEERPATTRETKH